MQWLFLVLLRQAGFQNGSVKEKLSVDGRRLDGTEELIGRFVGEK
jgi:hypothetical protein